MKSASRNNRLNSRLLASILILALAALACNVGAPAQTSPVADTTTPLALTAPADTSAAPNPAAAPTNGVSTSAPPPPATAAPPPAQLGVALFESVYSDANGWNKSPYWNTLHFADVNGDGRADLCGRGIAGVYCSISNGASFAAAAQWDSILSDANGWNKSPYWNTIQFADVNHDGKADLCARGIAGVYCGTSNGSAFSTLTLWLDNFSDANGWNKSPYFESIRYPDINGDGQADVCGRGGAGIYCGYSSGASFSAVTLWETTLNDANGWNHTSYVETIQYGDVNHDGKADLCARGILGMYCGLSNGTSFGTVSLWESSFSDANGWNKSPFWNTLQLADVNGDGSADICARGHAGIYCALSNSAAFSAVTLWESNFSDANGWNNSPYWNTLRYADVNHDSRQDVCGRGLLGTYCELSNGSAFGTASLWENNFSDANGWNKEPYWDTLALADVNGDGSADICARGILGEYCGVSNGTVFHAP